MSQPKSQSVLAPVSAGAWCAEIAYAIAYVDLGNLQADLQTGYVGGYHFGWLTLWSTTLGFIIQLLAVRRHCSHLQQPSHRCAGQRRAVLPLLGTAWTHSIAGRRLWVRMCRKQCFRGIQIGKLPANLLRTAELQARHQQQRISLNSPLNSGVSHAVPVEPGRWIPHMSRRTGASRARVLRATIGLWASGTSRRLLLVVRAAP
jgi:hypothetical protein